MTQVVIYFSVHPTHLFDNVKKNNIAEICLCFLKHFFYCFPSKHVNYFFIIYLVKSAAEGRQNFRLSVIEFDIKSSFMYFLYTSQRAVSEFMSNSGHRGYG